VLQMRCRTAALEPASGKLVPLKFGNRALDLIDQLFALVVANHRADIAALLLGVDFPLCGGAYPALNIGSNVTQKLRPPRRVTCQNGEISMVAVEIFNRPAIGFEKAVVIGEEEPALFLVHFDDGALELWQRIEDLSRLCYHLLFARTLT